MKKVLVTGGAGYIGSHTVVELLNSGYEPVIVDNFSNSSPDVIERISKITSKNVECLELDLCDNQKVDYLFKNHRFDSVIHFASLKAVGESVKIPIKYYKNNLTSSMNLCEKMQKYKVKNIIFSSSATVYGDPVEVPIKETAPVKPTNPYGQTKAMIEQILQDFVNANRNVCAIFLRYFNPIGAHASGLIGENPKGLPNNLLPYVSQVAAGTLSKLKVFGADYPTPDGTGIRDYIHVIDLAKGHIAALNHMPKLGKYEVYNLGSGKGSSVLEVISAFEKASGKKIPYEIIERRSGDIAICYADPSKANKNLHWSTQCKLEDACSDAWNWQLKSQS